MGFKDLTPNNWDAPDPVSELFVRPSPIVGVVSMNGNDWARLFLGVELSDRVPQDIRDLFAVARGTMVYGWFFYPLFQLGQEQLFRVAEAAARERYHALGGEDEQPAFYDSVEYLVEHGAIAAEGKERWEGFRYFRNAGSHPRRQVVMPPGPIAGALMTMAERIEALYAGE
jgi:hypothetical protein